MNETNQENNSDTLPAMPVKRKRGRPRKDQSLNRVESVRPRKDQSLNRLQAPVPPGFEGVNGNKPHQVDPSDGATDVMVGQAVTGVVEASFDAGYLLAVKIGNSNTILRGVVFKPGHYAPVTAENDVAPHVQMIRRNEIQVPKEYQIRVHGSHHSRSKERNDQLVNYLGNGSPPANQVHRLTPPTKGSSKGKYVSVVAAPSVPPVGARGTVVPVVLQPIDLSNGSPPANQLPPAASQAAHLAALKGKDVQTVAPLAVYPPNGSTPIDQVLVITSQALPSESQSSPHMTPKGVKNEHGLFNQGTLEFREGEETKSMKSTDIMQGEVNKEVQFSTQFSGTHNGNNDKEACRSSVEYSGVAPEREIGDMNEPLFIEPLRTVRSGLYNQPASIPISLENNRTGRMTELLQAVQQNLIENQAPHVAHWAAESRVEFHDLKRHETDLAEEETIQSQKRAQA